ncbi:MAG: hypothetical protein C5B48_13360 [Candidatus Rokuibacteriota bacterium]|nr:MAG: hypothetical protein C5B48_13360 [Candidatus Rokubacteria bacterium]
MFTSLNVRSAILLAGVFAFVQPPAFAQDGLTTTRNAFDERLRIGRGADYWTLDRIKEAQPLPWYDQDKDLGAAAALQQGVPPVGSPGLAPGGDPGPNQGPPRGTGAGSLNSLEDEGAADDATADDQDVAIDFGSQDIGDNYPANKTVFYQKQYPWRTTGKLFFTAAGGGSAYCTASVISGNNIIVTAAHCCYDRGVGSFHSNWSFAPAIRNTNRPYGTFPYQQARVLTAWVTSGGRQNDVCVLQMGPNAAGQSLSSRTGWLGRSWNYSTVQHHFDFGYPGNIDSGNFSETCAAETYANCGDPNVLAMGCNMTFGSSGGPWLRVYKPHEIGARNYVNSVVSGYDGCTGTFGQSFNGARFTSDNIVVLCNAQGC